MATDRLYNFTDYNIQELQNSWFDAYRGKSKWLEQEYQGLQGYRQKRTRLTMGVAKTASAELANLLFSEPPQINCSDTVLKVLKENKFLKNTKNLSEYIAALGGGAFKLRSDGEKIIIDYVKAYNIKPVTWDNKRVYEADFYSKKTIGDKVYQLVEKHRKAYEPVLEDEPTPDAKPRTQFVGYSIETQLLDDNNNQVPLPDDMIRYQIIPVKEPLFAYMTTSLANNFNPDSPEGISYFANAMDTLKALDIAFDSLYSEIELGQKRIIVPSSALRSVINPDTKRMEKYFDSTDRVFMALKSDDDTNKLDIIDNSVELRVDEIKSAIQTLLDIFCMQVGFSAGYLAFDGESVKTATEVISDNSKTFKTKAAFENEIAEGMVDIMNSIKELLKENSTDEFSVTFDDSVIEDRNSKQEYWSAMVTNGFATKLDAIMKIWGISEEEAQKKLDLIKAETPTPSTAFVGL